MAMTMPPAVVGPSPSKRPRLSLQIKDGFFTPRDTTTTNIEPLTAAASRAPSAFPLTTPESSCSTTATTAPAVAAPVAAPPAVAPPSRITTITTTTTPMTQPIRTPFPVKGRGLLRLQVPGTPHRSATFDEPLSTISTTTPALSRGGDFAPPACSVQQQQQQQPSTMPAREQTLSGQPESAMEITPSLHTESGNVSSPEKSESQPTMAKAPTEAPYKHPRSLRSILRNSPLPRRSPILSPRTSRSASPFKQSRSRALTLRVPSSPSQTKSPLSPDVAQLPNRSKKVCYLSPIEQTITTSTYTASHIDLLAEDLSPASPASPMSPLILGSDLANPGLSSLSSSSSSLSAGSNGPTGSHNKLGLTVKTGIPFTEAETRNGGFTPGPGQEMRRKMAGVSASCHMPDLAARRRRKRRERKQMWVWTIGNEEEDDREEEVTTAGDNEDLDGEGDEAQQVAAMELDEKTVSLGGGSSADPCTAETKHE